MPANTNDAKAAHGRIAKALFSASLVLGLALALFARPAAADVQYVYDEIGRLIQVIDQNGESARYVYDAAGNILRIDRISAGTLAVTSFTPKSGPVGTSVTIYGSGFSTAPADDAVQFNGTAATVTSATANQLVATVPAGATTGPIGVTVGTQTVTSADSFTVTTGSAGAPAITGFTPGGGAPGTAVTISGTNFDLAPANDVVRFNDIAQAAVSSATNTQITATVPNYAGSGPISVRTPGGTAVSADDFIVPPAGYAYADIIASARVAIDGAAGSLAIGTANKHGIVLFSAAGGDFLSLQISSLSVSPSGSVAYKVFDPKNFQIASGSVSTTAMSIHLPALAAAGTYSIIFSPGAATANLTFNLTRNPVLSAAQPTLNSTITVAGQSIRAVFAGTSGTSALLRLGVASTTPANQSVSMTVYKDALQIATASGSSGSDGAAIGPFSLAYTGTYFVVLAPSNAATGALSVTLNPPMDLAIDGPPVSVSTSIAGNGKRVLFSATAGQQIGLALTGLAYNPSGSNGADFRVYAPNGSQVIATSCYPSNPGGGCTLGIVNLPTTGTYQVLIQPWTSVTFSGTLTASTPLSSPMTSGTPLPSSITRNGQFAYGTFSGSAGQAVTLRMDVASTAPAAQGVVMSLWGPSGQVGSSVSATQSSDGVILNATLPATGNYAVSMVPSYGATGSMTLTLNPAMDFAIDSAPLAVSTSTAGYPRRVLFSATAGQQIGLALTGLAYNPSGSNGADFRVYAPNGSQVIATSCYPSNPGGGCTLGIVNLPTTGTYQVLIQPWTSVTFTGTLTASTPIGGGLTSGTPLALNIARSGQFSNNTFSGTAGQLVTLRLNVASTTPAAQGVVMSLWGPNGQVGSSVTATQSSDGVILNATLPSTGNYAVTAVPNYGATGSMTLTLNPAMDFAIDGAPLAVSTSTAGYPRRVLFSGTAGQQIALALTGLTYNSGTNGANFTLYAPNGVQVVGTSCYPTNPGGGCTLGIVNLPTTGTYQVLIQPWSSVTFSGTLTASTPISGPLTASTPLALDMARSGQFSNNTFSGTAGQLVTLRLDVASTTPAAQGVVLSLWGPNGQIGSSVTATQSSDGVILNATLPSTGNYAVTAVPNYGATGSMTLTLNPAMDFAIDGAPLAVSTSTAGYPRRVLFSATAGQQIGLALTGFTYNPSGSNGADFRVYAPNGSQVIATSCYPSNPGGGCTLGIVNLPTTGTYQVLIQPWTSVTFTGTLTASTPIGGGLTSGTPLALNIARSGQFSNNTFSGTAGQPATLRLSVASTTPANQSVTMTLWDANGQVGSSVTGTPGSDGVLSVASLPITGNYAVTAVPSYGATTSMTLTLNPAP